MNNDKRFEDRLLSELTTVVSARTAPATRLWTRPRLAAAGTASVAGVALAVGVPALLGGAAYAVTDEGDGVIRVEISDVTDADGLEAALAEHGIDAEVDYLPDGQVCAGPRYTPADIGELTIGAELTGEGGPLAFELTVSDFAESTLVLVLSGDEVDLAGVEIGVARGVVAPCDPVDGFFPSDDELMEESHVEETGDDGAPSVDSGGEND